MAKLDLFTQGYISAMLLTEVGPPFGFCPICNQDDQVLEHVDGKVRVCGQHGKEPNSEMPLDRNYIEADIDQTTLDGMRMDCARFQYDNAQLLANAYAYLGPENAGHDFWLTRNRHGAGFLDGDWQEFGDLLANAAHKFFEVHIYIGDDGKIHA